MPLVIKAFFFYRLKKEIDFLNRRTKLEEKNRYKLRFFGCLKNSERNIMKKKIIPSVLFELTMALYQ